MRKAPRDEEAGAGAHASPSVPPETISDGVKLLRAEILLFTQKCSPVRSESPGSATALRSKVSGASLTSPALIKEVASE